MFKRKKYPFEGELLTIGEIHRRVPALSRSTIEKHLKKGVTKRADMLHGFRPKRKGTPGWNAIRKAPSA